MYSYKSNLQLLLERERTTKIICSELNNFVNLEDTLKLIIKSIATLTNCKNVGIRLNDNGQYPFFVYEGFSDEFIQSENDLFKKDDTGNKIYCKNKNGYILECVCGNILEGNFDANCDFFTSKGSFWTSNSLLVAKNSKLKEIVPNRRGTCSKHKFKSIAIIPIKARGKIVGLIHLSDLKEGMFSIDLIEYIETIGEHIGLAIQNNLLYLQLQQQLDEQKKLTERLEHLNACKTDFFSSLSHELRTPLNIMLGAIQLIKLNYDFEHSAENSDKISSYFTTIQQNCYRLLRLIGNIIDISKSESNFIESTFEKHNIVSVVEDITLSVVPYAEYKNLNIIFDTDIEEKYVYCDPDKIERIILNLISNSLKFTQPNGTIYVTITESSSEKILIKVKDTGIGIPKEMISKVFERYKQLGSKNHQSQGSGIGLSLVKSIVTTHNGSIWVESEVGKGSEFFIELPCDDSINYTSPERTNANSLTQDYVEKLKVEFSDIYSF